MKLYDLTVIVPSEKNKDHIDALIKEYEGEVLDFGEIGKKTFAYPIKKELEGFYFQYIVKIDPEQSAKITKALASDAKILRHLMLSTRNEKIKKPVVIEEKFEKQLPPVKQIEIKPTASAKSEKETAKEPAKSEKIVKKISKKEEQERQKTLDEKLEQILKE